MNIYERIYGLLTEGSLGAARKGRLAYSKTRDKTNLTGKVNAKRALRGIKNTGRNPDPTQTLGAGKPELYQRAVKAGHRKLPRTWHNT